MVKVQNQSIAAQLQILRNNVRYDVPLFRDANYEGTQYLNQFHEAILNMVVSMRDLLVIEANGTYQLTEFGLALQNFAIKGIKELDGILQNILPLAQQFLSISKLGVKVLEVYLIPVKMIVRALEIMGPELTKLLISFHLLNKILPISAIVQYAYNLAMLDSTKATTANITAQMTNTIATNSYKNALITAVAWKKIKAYWTKVDTVETVTNSNAELYARGLKIMGFTLSATEQANMTREIFLKKLKTQGIVIEGAAIKGLHAKKTVGIALSQMEIAGEKNLIRTIGSGVPFRYSSAWATEVDNTAKAKNVTLTWSQTFANMKETAGTILSTAWTWLKVAAKWALLIVMLPLTVVTWAFGAAVMAASWPVILMAVAVIALVAGFVILFQKINEQIDVMFYLKEMVMGLVGVWIWLAKVMIAPFVWAGEKIAEFLEGPLFVLAQTIGHFFKMLMWYFKRFVKWITEDAGSSLSSVLTAPFNACKDAVLWLVGVLITNEDSLWNHMKGFWKWLDETFGLSDKFNAAKDAAKAMWDWIKENITWDNIKIGLEAVGEGIANALLAPLRGVEFAWNWVVDSISGKGFTVWNPVPGDNDFKLAIPNLSAWKLNLSDKIAEQLGLADGGYVRAMANGGMASLEGKFPYMVGEEGPELFAPSSPGRIIANKDLNTQRVNNMLRDAFDLAPREGAADKTNRMGTLYIDKLEASSAKMKKSRFGVDTFA
jgi:hypothetical protein